MSMKPKAWLIQSTSSSVRRLMCTIASEAAAVNSIAKSRSLTASSAFWQTPSMPSALRHGLAVERVAGAGQRRGAQRQAVDALAHVGHALGVAREHLHVGQHVVAEAHRLRHLQVGEAGHDHVGVLLGEVQQRLLQVGQQLGDQVDLAAQPQPHVGGDLVVAAAAGVQALAGIAHQLGQARLDVQVHVFEVELPVEGAGFDLAAICAMPALDGGVVLPRR